jgi:hypothetical protein
MDYMEVRVRFTLRPFIPMEMPPVSSGQEAEWASKLLGTML